jgi:hypothetical protein
MFNNNDSPTVKWRPRLGMYTNASKNARLFVKDDKHGKADKRKPYLATSYNWWVFFKYINGKAVFNAGYYSQQTSAHQSGVKAVLKQLRIKYVTIRSRYHLEQTEDMLEDLHERLYEAERRLTWMQSRKIRPSRWATPAQKLLGAKSAVLELQTQIKQLAKLGIKLSKAKVKALRADADRKRAEQSVRDAEDRKRRNAMQRAIAKAKKDLLDNSWNTSEDSAA